MTQETIVQEYKFIKPTVQLTGQDGNVFNLLGICINALRKAGYPEKVQELKAKVKHSRSYGEALIIMMEYCDVE